MSHCSVFFCHLKVLSCCYLAVFLSLFSGAAVERGSSTQYFALASTAPTTTVSSGASVFGYTQLHETKKEDLQL